MARPGCWCGWKHVAIESGEKLRRLWGCVRPVSVVPEDVRRFRVPTAVAVRQGKTAAEGTWQSVQTEGEIGEAMRVVRLDIPDRVPEQADLQQGVPQTPDSGQAA